MWRVTAQNGRSRDEGYRWGHLCLAVPSGHPPRRRARHGLSGTHHICTVPSEALVAIPPTWSRVGSPSTMATSVRMRLGRPISTP